MTDPEIKKYLRMSDFYEILGVQKDSNENDIKKAYRKLALKFHPDRNRNVGATDVFKKISQAYDCLMNAEKKSFYDRYGQEEPQVQQQRYRQQHSQEIDPNDIFSFFFNGQNPFGPQFHQGQQRRQNGQQNGNGGQNGTQRQQQNMSFIGLLPIIFLLLPTIISFFEAVPTYQMQRSYSHQNKRETQNLKVLYFVNDDFFVKSRTDKFYIQRIDFSIEQDYVKNIKDECHYMHINKQRLLRQSQQYNKGSYSEKILRGQAESLDMRACEKYQEVQERPDFKKYL